MLTDRDLARWRLRTQRLVAPHAPDAQTVVTHHLAVQAENPQQSAWAVACRTSHPDPDDLAQRLDEGSVLRTAPGVDDITSWGGGEREFQVHIDPQRLYARDLGFSDVIDAIAANSGQVGGNVLDVGREQYLVRGLGLLKTAEDIGGIVLKAEDGVPVYVRDVAEVRQAPAPRFGAVTRDGEDVHLTPTEFDLLAVLATNAGKVLTHRHLLERVWGGYAADNAQQLRVYINYLRRKLEDDPAHPVLIVTEPGVGYRLRA